MFIKVLTVSQITNYIKKMFEADPILRNISIKGEISNFKHHYSGHMYFTLKDDNARIKCVMFKSSCSNLKFMPEDGMNVIISGSISLYERDGQYQIYVNEMQPDGLGALFAAFEQLKKRLENEGLFDISHKVPIPKYPSRIGVVTSSTGAAVRDIINIISRRYPGISILIVPVLVQGSGASEEIAEAIRLLNIRNDVDVIIVGRGGGSIEELWAFNEEPTARAIYDSRIPVISAVGHETDFTISDFAADLRASTPSAAAELCVPDKKELVYRINACCNSLYSFMSGNIKNIKGTFNQYVNMIRSLNPGMDINRKRQYLDSLYLRAFSLIRHKLDLSREITKKHAANLEALNPLSIITRGYSVAYVSGTKEIIDSVTKVKTGDNIKVLVSGGSLGCVVNNIMEGENNGRKNISKG